MRRIYACIAMVAVLLVSAFYSSWKVQHFHNRPQGIGPWG